MFDTLYRLLYRDRRRLAFSGTLVVIATLLGRDTLPDPIPGIQIEYLAFSLIILAMPLIAIYAPSYRYLVELGAVSNLLFVAIGRVLPQSHFVPANEDGSLLKAAVLYGLTILAVHYITYGRWSDRFKGPKKVVSRARVTTRLEARPMWFGLVPTPGHLDECPDPDVVSIDYVDKSRRTIRLITWQPGSPMGEVLLHVDELETLKRTRLTIEVVQGKRDQRTEGTTTFEVVDLGHQRVLYVSHEMAELPWRRALRGWLDDTLGRIMDVRLSVVEAAHCQSSHYVDHLPPELRQCMSPAEVMDALCPSEKGRGMRDRRGLDAFTLTRDEKGVEARLAKPLVMGKRAPQEVQTR